MNDLALPAGVGRVITAPELMAPFLRDWTGRYVGAARCVVQPGTTLEVAALLQWCNARRVPVVSQGGNTSLAGGAVPGSEDCGVVLSLAQMNKLRALDPENNTVTVEAGMVLQRLRELAQEAGRLFPLALGAQGSCTIGGNLSSNAGGYGALAYGTARDLCLGLELVTPAGAIYDGLRGLRKDNTGYDLKDLFIGAEGTLGVITAATLKLFPLPAAQATGLAALSTPQQALRLLAMAQQALGSDLSAFELISAYCVELVRRKFPDTPEPFARPAAWYVLLESSDHVGEAHARERFESLIAAAEYASVLEDAVIAQSLAQSSRLWEMRERIGLSQPKNIKHDISLPISRIADFIQEMEAVLKDRFPGTRPVVLGHFGDGNLHYNVEPEEGLSAEQFLALEKLVHRTVYDLVESMRGSISAEHGIGAAKVDDLERYKPSVALEMMSAIKNALDPRGILNPGKVLKRSLPAGRTAA